MIVYPAMDLIDGKPVRLTQGRFEEATHYPEEPLEALQRFVGAGARWAHVVDLDGAKARSPRQQELIARLARSSTLKLQVGGGFRTERQIGSALDNGVARVVVGSVAVERPQEVTGWIETFGTEHICISLDVRMVGGVPLVAKNGWLEESGLTLWDVARRLPRAGHVLITDIEADGMLRGPNLALYREAAERLPGLQIQASGGVSSLRDLEALPTAGAIVGKALWEGRVRLEEALSLARA